MKKVFLLITVILFGLGLASCAEKVDPAEAHLQTAYDSLNAVISDPSNITGNFNAPTTLANGVSAEWVSSNPGVVTVGNPNGGFSIITVNRPAFGDANVKVTLTVELSIPSELKEGETLTKEWTIEITVIANTVEIVNIENVADILAITNAEYDGTLQVEIPNMTIIAKGDTTFAYDGTGVIQVYGGLQETLEVGKVYTVSGTLQWYFGIWEIEKWTAVEQTSATAQFPTKEVITSVDTKIDELIANEEHMYPTVASGNFEPIHATITGKIYMVPGDTGNYNTFIIDSANDSPATGIPGSDEAPATGFMFYYGTSDFAAIRLYNGLEVTIDVVIYTYRTNNKAFAIYYVGGPEGIEANLTDQQKLDLDVAALSVPAAITEATTLVLPTEGANGSTIVWESNSDLINATTGVVTMPEGDAVSVKLTASIAYEGLVPVTKNYYINVGILPTVTMAGLLDMVQGQLAYAEAEVFWIKSDGKAAILADETGAGYVYFGIDMRSQIALGDYIGLSFSLNIYYGLYQMGNPKLANKSDLVGEDPNLELTAIEWTATEAQAFFDDSVWGPHYVTMTLTGYASGDYTNGTLEGFEPFIQTQGATSDLRDVQFTFTGWVIDRRSDKIAVEGTYTIIE